MKVLRSAKLRRILGRDDETEVVAIILAALGEGAFIGRVGGGVEHARVLAVACHALALQVGDVLGQRRRTEARALMAHDARLHHHAPGVRAQPDRDRRAAAAAEPRAAAALARSEAVADMPGLLRGPHHLADEGLRALAAAVAVLDAPGPDAQVVVARRHGPKPQAESDRRRSEH